VDVVTTPSEEVGNLTAGVHFQYNMTHSENSLFYVCYLLFYNQVIYMIDDQRKDDV